MARIRSIKPEYWADQDLAEQVSRDARLLYVGLWNLADEHSRLRGDPRYIKGQIFPYDDDLSPNDIEMLLDELAVAGKVIRYRAASGTYVFLPNLASHQRLEPDKVTTKLPAPDAPGSVPLTPRAAVFPEEPEPHANSSENGADFLGRVVDGLARGAEDHALLYGTGSMEHVSPSSADGPTDDPGGLFDADRPEALPPTPSTHPKRSWETADIECDPNWVEFWEAYPRKTDKGHARKAWLKALRNGIDPGTLTIAAAAFRDDPKRSRDIRYVPHPTTWLNGERYNDYTHLDPGESAGPPPFWEA